VHRDPLSWWSRSFALGFACAAAAGCAAISLATAHAATDVKLRPSQLHLDRGKTTLNWAGQTVVGPAGQCDLASDSPFSVSLALASDSNGDALLHLDAPQTIRQTFAVSATSPNHLVLAFAGQNTSNYVAEPYEMTGYGTAFTGLFHSRSGDCAYTTPEKLELSGTGLTIEPGAVPSTPVSSVSAATAPVTAAPASVAPASAPASTGPAVGLALWVVLGMATLALTGVIAVAAWQLELFEHIRPWLRLPK
jgi:hypothetical protein